MPQIFIYRANKSFYFREHAYDFRDVNRFGLQGHYQQGLESDIPKYTCEIDKIKVKTNNENARATEIESKYINETNIDLLITH